MREKEMRKGAITVRKWGESLCARYAKIITVSHHVEGSNAGEHVAELFALKKSTCSLRIGILLKEVQ